MNPPPPPPSTATPHPYPHPPPPPPPPSLHTTLSNLTSLLHLSTTTLHSLPTTTATTTTLLPCPFNPNHHLPPSSLFSHYLNCPENQISHFTPATTFFYQNCPGPVAPSSTHHPPPLNLPRILQIECGDIDTPTEEPIGFPVNSISFLPSEIWAVRSEIESWGGNCPNQYSSRILRAVIRLRDCEFLRLRDWIVTNSPKYGVVIDFVVRDHVVLLVRLCLKAIVREAFGLAGVGFSDGGCEINRSFECRVLVEVVMWLGLQFSVLYGEVNGKFFAVDLLKECISDSASHASFFPLEGNNDESNEVEKVDGEVNIKGQTVGSSSILISQVVAAVTALHERSVVEEKIKALRNSRPLSAYQRNMEHAYISKIADEERQKRPDYRPVIDHDGFLWQRSINPDTGKVKTREELLAEERDYKRRRMSYRGKKLKRNTLEVTRAIIDEYMEEIKLAGGIGDMSKAMKETEPLLTSENIYTNASATGVSGSRRNPEVSEEKKSRSHDYKKELNSRHDSEVSETHWDNGFRNSNKNVKRARDYEKSDYVEFFEESSSRRSHSSRRESLERNNLKRDRDERERSSRKRERDEHERTSRKRDDHERTSLKRERDEYERTSRKRERYEHEKTSHEHERTSRKRERYEDNREHGDRRRSKTKRSSSSRPELDEFEDRYDPAKSRDF